MKTNNKEISQRGERQKKVPRTPRPEGVENSTVRGGEKYGRLRGRTEKGLPVKNHDPANGKPL